MGGTVIKTPAGRCRFGLGTVDITPPPDSYHRNWGAAAHDAAAGIHRPLRAAALELSLPCRELPPTQEECSTLAPGALERILEAVTDQLRAWDLS